jgi:hypothetical protein
MGISDGRIQATQITASSVLNGDLVNYGTAQTRLNCLSAWRPIGTEKEYLTVRTFY